MFKWVITAVQATSFKLINPLVTAVEHVMYDQWVITAVQAKTL